jgi:hypothetical protein
MSMVVLGIQKSRDLHVVWGTIEYSSMQLHTGVRLT